MGLLSVRSTIYGLLHARETVAVRIDYNANFIRITCLLSDD